MNKQTVDTPPLLRLTNLKAVTRFRPNRLDGGSYPYHYVLAQLGVAFPFDPIVPLAFGISRSAAYRALAAGQLPITPLRLGRRLIVRRADLLEALSIPDTT